MRAYQPLLLPLLVASCGGEEFASSSGGTGAVGGAAGATAIDAGNDSGAVACGISGAEPRFYSTLDSLDAVLSPVKGDGSGATTNGSFVPGQCGLAVELENGATLSISEHNVDYSAGTIAFWYRPNFAHTDNQAHALLSSPDSGKRGIRIEKDAANLFVVHLWDESMSEFRLRVGSDAYSLRRQEWVHLRVTWDTKQNAALMHAYFNGVEPSAYLSSDSGPILAAATGNGNLSLGCCVGSAAAVFDELMIYDELVR